MTAASQRVFCGALLRIARLVIERLTYSSEAVDLVKQG